MIGFVTRFNMFQSAVIFVICHAVFMFGEVIFWQFYAPPLVGGAALALLGTLVSLGLLFIFRNHRKSETIAGWIFLISVLELVYHIGLNHDYYVAEEWPHETFIGIKIAAGVFAMLCPPLRWSAASSFLALMIAPIWIYYSFDEKGQLALGIQEPWVTVGFAIICAIIYSARTKITKLQAEVEQREANLRLVRNIAHLNSSVQHLVNTPSQEIELAVGCIANDFPETKPMIDRIAAAFAKITKVNSVLALTSSQVEWRDHKLPENVEELERQLQELIQKTS